MFFYSVVHPVFRPYCYSSILAFCFFACLLGLSGCGKKKQIGKKDYGKPTWQQVDSSQFAPLSELETSLEGGQIIVNDPEGWDRMSRGAAKAPKGFRTVIVFQQSDSTIMMTRSEKAKDMPDLNEDNIETFAVGAQELFKTPVKMIKLGDIVGVYFSKRAKDAQSVSKTLNRRIIATSIGGSLYTYELISNKSKFSKDDLNALYALIAKTKIDVKPTEFNANEFAVASTEPDKFVEPIEVATAKPESTATSTTKPETNTAALTPEPVKPVEVAAVEPIVKPTAKPESKKPTKPASKGNTKDILNELESLLGK